MKLEAGKYYKTRDGRKAFVAAAYSPFASTKPRYEMLGWLDGETGSYHWTDDGGFRGDSQISPIDLISEWREPIKGEAWLAINPNGDPAGHIFKSVAKPVDNYYRFVHIRYEELP